MAEPHPAIAALARALVEAAMEARGRIAEAEAVTRTSTTGRRAVA